MKTTKIMNTIILVFSFLLLINCSKEDDKIKEQDLIGMWNSTTEIFGSYYTGIEFFESGEYQLFADELQDGKITGKSNIGNKWQLESQVIHLIGDSEKETITWNLEIEKLSNDELWIIHVENNYQLIKFYRYEENKY